MITVSAPGKLLLMGEHAAVYGRPCIVTAVDARLSVSLEPNEKEGITIDAPQSSDARFVSEAIAVGQDLWKTRLPAMTVHTKSQFSTKIGFGSSGAVTVASFYALREFLRKTDAAEACFVAAYSVSKKIQGGGSGVDVAASLWGHTLYYENFGETIDPISLADMPLVVGYTGVKADTMTIVSEVAAKRMREPAKVDRIFDAIGALVAEAKTRMEEGDWERVGKLFDFNQDYLRDLGVSSEKLESLIVAAKAAGAWGAKLSGAGGGDCMIALAPAAKIEAVKAAIQKAGGEVIPVLPNAEGVRVES